MIDKEKISGLLGRYIRTREASPAPVAFDPETDFRIPVSAELSRNVDETIAFLRSLEPLEFSYMLEVLDKVTAQTQSARLLKAVRRIGAEKGCDEKYMETEIRLAGYYLIRQENDA